MTQDQILKNVRDFADRSHGEQMRKYTPERYIVHPVRVMEILKNYTEKTSVLCAALLHDVLEDTPVTANEIRNFLLTLLNEKETEDTIRLVIELTDVYVKKDYPQFNRRKRKSLELERIKKTSAETQTIKYADIMDNCKEIVAHDSHFARVFLFECKKMLEQIKEGNKELYRQTTEHVENKIRELKK